jgi:hypothetical protein
VLALECLFVLHDPYAFRYGIACCIVLRSQIIGCFVFSRYITFTIYIDIDMINWNIENSNLEFLFFSFSLLGYSL